MIGIVPTLVFGVVWSITAAVSIVPVGVVVPQEVVARPPNVSAGPPVLFRHFMNQLRLCNRSRAVATHLASFSRAWTHTSETGATCRALSRGGKRRPQRRTTSSSDQPQAASGSRRTSRCK